MLGRLGPKSSRGADISAGPRRGSGRSPPSPPVTSKDIGGYGRALAAPGRIPRGSFRGALRHLSVTSKHCRCLSTPPRARGARPAAPVLQRAGTHTHALSTAPFPRRCPGPARRRRPLSTVTRGASRPRASRSPRLAPSRSRAARRSRSGGAARHGAFAPPPSPGNAVRLPEAAAGHPNGGRPGNAARALAPGGNRHEGAPPRAPTWEGPPPGPVLPPPRRAHGLTGSAAPPRRPPEGRRPGPLARRGGGAGPSLGRSGRAGGGLCRRGRPSGL